jgi:ATP-dependent RNA helicase RhlE
VSTESPPPSFAALGLSTPLVNGVSHYAAPRPVQCSAIPAAIAGRDVIAGAVTGSGKTAAFVLPLLERWRRTDQRGPVNAHTLIVVPTRELAAQITQSVLRYTQHFTERFKVVTAYGGVSINPQLLALRGGADFIIGTPGRLLDLTRNNGLWLGSVQALVLDEADRLLDLGFAKELDALLKQLPERRQTLLFSATFPPVVQELAKELLDDPVLIDIESAPTDAPDIVQRAIEVDFDKRGPLLRHLIREEKWRRCLVFVASRYTADLVADKLRRHGIRAVSFHGELSQGARTAAISDFKEELIDVLVATDLAARGLDIPKMPVVVNFDLPRSADDYLHRIGRTGRAGESGLAVSFITADEHAHFMLIEKRNGLSIDREQLTGFEPLDQPRVPTGDATGGIKGKRKSKKDKLREAAAQAAQTSAPVRRV